MTFFCLLISKKCNSKQFQSFLNYGYIVVIKQALCEKSKPNITCTNGRTGQLQSNSVGLEFNFWWVCFFQ